MARIDSNNNNEILNQSESTFESIIGVESFLNIEAGTQLSYHELSETPVTRTNELIQLKANVALLTELSSKLRFLNKEIRYLLKV